MKNQANASCSWPRNNKNLQRDNKQKGMQIKIRPSATGLQRAGGIIEDKRSACNNNSLDSDVPQATQLTTLLLTYRAEP